jgi:hypothetical protein
MPTAQTRWGTFNVAAQMDTQEMAPFAQILTSVLRELTIATEKAMPRAQTLKAVSLAPVRKVLKEMELSAEISMSAYQTLHASMPTASTNLAVTTVDHVMLALRELIQTALCQTACVPMERFACWTAQCRVRLQVEWRCATTMPTVQFAAVAGTREMPL